MSNQPSPNHDSAAEHQAGAVDHAPEQEPISPRKVVVLLVVLVAAAVLLAVVGKLGRDHSNVALAQRTNEEAAPTVNVAPPTAGAPTDSFVLPGNVTAYTDAPIYARTDGYLVHWYFDIGAKVQKGALLAVIDTPELDKQVAQAQADLATAKTNAGNAKVQGNRYSR